jgi:hypothetical protein
VAKQASRRPRLHRLPAMVLQLLVRHIRQHSVRVGRGRIVALPEYAEPLSCGTEGSNPFPSSTESSELRFRKTAPSPRPSYRAPFQSSQPENRLTGRHSVVAAVEGPRVQIHLPPADSRANDFIEDLQTITVALGWVILKSTHADFVDAAGSPQRILDISRSSPERFLVRYRLTGTIA